MISLLIYACYPEMPITHIELGKRLRGRFGNRYAVIHRGGLHGISLRACRENPLVTLCTGSADAGYEQDGSTVLPVSHRRCAVAAADRRP